MGWWAGNGDAERRHGVLRCGGARARSGLDLGLTGLGRHARVAAGSGVTWVACDGRGVTSLDRSRPRPLGDASLTAGSRLRQQHAPLLLLPLHPS